MMNLASNIKNRGMHEILYTSQQKYQWRLIFYYLNPKN